MGELIDFEKYRRERKRREREDGSHPDRRTKTTEDTLSKLPGPPSDRADDDPA